MNGEESRDLVSIWLTEAGLQPLDKQGRACLQHEDKLDCLVEVPQEGGRFVLTAPFFFLDVASMVDVAQAALMLNLHQTATRGGTLALDGGTHLLVFTISFGCADVRYQDFTNILSNFLETALSLKAKLEQVAKQEEGISAAAIYGVDTATRETVGSAASGETALAEYMLNRV